MAATLECHILPPGLDFLWIVAAALDVCLPMKFFRHYFFALYPPVCLGATLALDALAAGWRKPSLTAWLLCWRTPITIWVMGVVRAAPWAGEDVPHTIAEIVQQVGARDGDLYVYRYQPVIYALPRLAAHSLCYDTGNIRIQ